MAPDGEHVVAIDVGGTSLKGAVIDRGGRVRHRAPGGPPTLAPARRASLEGVLDLAAELAEAAGRPVAMGLAVPGVVDEPTGT